MIAKIWHFLLVAVRIVTHIMIFFGTQDSGQKMVSFKLGLVVVDLKSRSEGMFS